MSSQADLKIDHAALDERLAELSISIPEGTLTRWAAEKLIPGPSAYFKKKKNWSGVLRLKKESKIRKNGVKVVHGLADEAVEMLPQFGSFRN